MIVEEFVVNDRKCAAFVDFGFEIYKNDTRWIPPFRKSIYELLDVKNPVYHNGRFKNFLVISDNAVIARCTAFFNQLAFHNDKQTGFIGLFEAVHDLEAASILLDAAIEYLREQGAAYVWGPVNFSTWENYRFLTGEAKHAPFYGEPYNPPYYPEMFAANGFKKIKTYYSHLITDNQQVLHSEQIHRERFDKNNYTIRPIQLGRFEHELHILYGISASAFRFNFGYTEKSFAGFRAQYIKLRPFIEKENILIAEDAHGTPAGYAFTFRDNADAIRRMNGSLDIFSKIKFIVTPKSPDTLIFKTIAVAPGLRKVRVGAALVYAVHEYAVRNGFARVIHALMSEDNLSRSFSGLPEIYNEYGLYGKEI
ncbi:MAG: hypothetical protein JW904_14235 [Spirochaetales bacterium]|nr:hypothetical protein [Spirochaetales bacterium]